MLSEIEKEIIETFELFDDPMDKYEHIIEIGNELPAMDEKFKTDDFIVKGCQSKVWLRAYKENGKIYYQADSNTVITKGIIALLVKVLSGNTPDVIVNHTLSFIDKIDLRGHLSSQRANGLTAMIGKMKEYAVGL
jgi:cysteine desulfuration protein SufE